MDPILLHKMTYSLFFKKELVATVGLEPPTLGLWTALNFDSSFFFNDLRVCTYPVFHAVLGYSVRDLFAILFPR